VYPYLIHGLATYALKKMTNFGMGIPNMVHNVDEKMSKAILKDGMSRRAKNQVFKFGLKQNFN